MNQEDYAYYLTAALHCDTALAEQRRLAAVAAGGPSTLSIIGFTLLAIVLLVAAASAAPQNGDPQGGDPSAGN